ncbi:uncharacterized protein NEMAJ01_0033 [Nematocida major]|uniref:uncharacterized protein n=1 Tax=Nematocida major TaxID=1912982 RepID=UPI0020078ED1|nr:uncharacterized protein NEMAJ01_0033 [Nematocida major]KAH9385137.1 hypothetical protein NEMAJ01_0033 [Nematocida major]
MTSLFNEILSTLKLSNTCSVSVGASVMRFVSSTEKLTAISTCDFEAEGAGEPRVYSTESLVAAISGCSAIQEVDEALIFTENTAAYTIVNTIQPLLYEFWPCSIPEEWSTKVNVCKDAFRKFIHLQQGTRTSVYLSSGVLYFCTEDGNSTNVMQISAINIVQEGTERVTVHFEPLKYLAGLLNMCEKVSIMYTNECFSIFLMFEGDVAHHRVVFRGVV